VVNQVHARPVWPGLIERYRERLPVGPSTPVVTLLEGGTPLVPAPVLSARTGCDVWLKVEGANPTGSFKDRGMTVAVSKALEAGARAVLCASTGNTSASAAAYAARAAIPCAVVIPEGRIALGKLAQALVHGASVLAVDGSFDDCLVLVRELAERYPVALVNSVNPLRIQGQKTVAFEIVEALGDAPDVHCIPVGNAGNITATWLGYTEATERRPRMLGFQAAGAAPLVAGAPVERPATIASAIRIGRPASAEGARRAVAESGGRLAAVTDRQILAAYRLLAREEGVFVEMASAASVAGLLDAGVERGRRVVCTVTGNGLKDPDWALAGAPPPTRVAADPEAAAAALSLSSPPPRGRPRPGGQLVAWCKHLWHGGRRAITDAFPRDDHRAGPGGRVARRRPAAQGATAPGPSRPGDDVRAAPHPGQRPPAGVGAGRLHGAGRLDGQPARPAPGGRRLPGQDGGSR
jgi:threonine synthase